MNTEPSRPELLQRIAELEARVAAFETGEAAAERSLRESEARLRLFIENVPAAIAMFDRDMRYIAVSHGWRKEYLNGSECLGRLHYDVFPECPERWRAAHRKGLAGEIVRVDEDVWRRADGTELYARYEVRPWHTADGNIGGIILLTEDVTGPRRGEAALRESEERFRIVADTAPVMIWVAGLDKGCTFLNKPWLDFTGRTTYEQLGDGWLAGVHPQDLQSCAAKYGSAFDAHSRFQMEYRLRRADGQYRWILTTGIPLYRSGEFAGYIGSCIDLTEKKLIEERLRASEIQLKDAQRLANVGSWEFDIASERVHWSDETYRLYGIAVGTAMDRTGFLSRVHPDDLAIVLMAEDRAVSSATPIDLEFRILRLDGEVRYLRSILQAVRNDEGRPVRLFGATQDITEQVRARELLRDSEERLKRAEFLTHVGNWSWDIATDRLSWSEELYRIFGNARSFVPTYESYLEAIVPHDRERMKQWVIQCLADKDAQPVEYQIVRPDGDVRTLVSTPEVVLGENGKAVRMFGACQDVTHVRRAQREIFAAQKLESVGTLASGIAHDFNNLLGGVLAQAELGLAELAAGGSPVEELNGIRATAMRGAEIVRELMIYAGKETAAIGMIDVSQTVSEMLVLLKISVSKHAVIETDLGKNLPPIRGSAAQLRQVVMNLVTNASDAIDERGGWVRVVTRCMRRDMVGSDGLPNGEYIQLEVSDSGCGMPAEMQSRVFDPFFTTKSAGTGLGLAVVDGIVRGLHGSIEVRSEPGRGSSFVITLPCARAHAASDHVESEPEERTGVCQEIRLLIVEDEESLRHAVVKLLRRRGFEVLEAADGTAAIDILRGGNQCIDLILLDMTIPGRPSHEVVREAEQTRPGCKVLLTSAYHEELVTATLSGPQIRGFVRKPFQLENLLHSIGTALSSEAADF